MEKNEIVMIGINGDKEFTGMLENLYVIKVCASMKLGRNVYTGLYSIHQPFCSEKILPKLQKAISNAN